MQGVSMTIASSVDVQVVSISAINSMYTGVYRLLCGLPAVWACMVYPSPPPTVYTCRVYPSPPPVMWTCTVCVSLSTVMQHYISARCIPIYVVLNAGIIDWTARHPISPVSEQDYPVRYQNAPVPD